MVRLPIVVLMLSAVTPAAHAVTPPVPVDRREAPAGQLKSPAEDTVAFRNSIYDTAGRVTSSLAASNGGTFELYLWRRASFCDSAGASDGPPTEAAYGWRVAVQTLGFKSVDPGGQSGAIYYTEVTIALEWQRLWERGRRVNEPAGKMKLTLRPGDRVPIDTIVAPADAAACAASSMTLAVEPAPASRVMRTSAGSATGGRRAGGEPNGPTKGAPEAGGTAGFVKSRPALDTGRTVPASTLNYTYSCGNARLGNPLVSSVVMADANGCAAASSDLDPALLQVLNVDLWLVHRAANGATEQSYRRVTTTPADGRFAFPPVAFETSAGTRTLEVTGFAQAQRAAKGPERFEIGFARRTAMVAAGGIGMGIGVGAGSHTIDMPKAGEVVSIELPPAQGALPGDQFSLRVRVVR